MIALVKKLTALNIDPDQLAEQAQSVYNKLKESGFDLSSFLESFKSSRAASSGSSGSNGITDGGTSGGSGFSAALGRFLDRIPDWFKSL